MLRLDLDLRAALARPWPRRAAASRAAHHRADGGRACQPAVEALPGTAADEARALDFAKPLIVRSAYRSPEHNRAVGGAKASKHLEGIAFDIAMANHDPEAFEAAARAVGFQGFGFYPRSGFIHIDLGPARSWGERFPKAQDVFRRSRRRRRGRCSQKAAR